MDRIIDTLEELAQITAIMPETRFQMALTMAITDLNRARQLEAECAAMHKALEAARDLYECAYYEGFYARMGYKEEEQKWASNAKKILTNMKQALSSSAGKDLLEKVQRLEAEIKENERHIHMLQNTLPAGVVEKTLQLEAVAEAAKEVEGLGYDGISFDDALDHLRTALATLEGGSE